MASKREIMKQYRARGIKVGSRVHYVNPRFVPDSDSVGCEGDFGNGHICRKCAMPSASHWVAPLPGTVTGFNSKNGYAEVTLDIGAPRLLAFPSELTLISN